MRVLLESTYRQALRGADPLELTAQGLPAERPDLVLAVGKASLPMVEAVLKLFPDVPWLASPPAVATGGQRAAAPAVGELDELRRERKRTVAPPTGANGEIITGSHPLPDESSVRAADRALELAERLGAGELLLLLVSGGGSALWSAPVGVTLEEKRALTTHLQRAGADIAELNTVRRHLSRVKGGGLLMATRANVLSLVLSDVPGGGAWDVASGPGASDPTTFADALDVLKRFPGEPTKPAIDHLSKGAAGEVHDTVKPGSAADARSDVRVVGSSKTLLYCAAQYLEREVGVQAIVLHHDLVGEARVMAERHAELVASVMTGRDPRPLLPLLAADPPYAAWRLMKVDRSQPVALLSGGEATVKVRGDGRGGRNQEFALALALALWERVGGAGVWALSAGSDGVDGSSDAAGAFVTPDTLERGASRGLDARAALERNDSHAFFAALGDQLMTGPTGHNLNDLRVLVLPPPETVHA